MADIDDTISSEVEQQLALERDLQKLENELMTDSRFKAFIELQKTVKDQSEKAFAHIQAEMEKHNVKSISSDAWGSITLAERVSFEIDSNTLDQKYFKEVPDTAKIGKVYKLEGVAPAGATPRYTRYLLKKFK